MSAKLRWTLAIVALLGCNVAAMIYFAITASTHAPQIISVEKPK